MKVHPSSWHVSGVQPRRAAMASPRVLLLCPGRHVRVSDELAAPRHSAGNQHLADKRLGPPAYVAIGGNQNGAHVLAGGSTGSVLLETQYGLPAKIALCRLNHGKMGLVSAFLTHWEGSGPKKCAWR